MRYFVDMDDTIIRGMDSKDLKAWTRKVMKKNMPLNLPLLKWLKARKAEGNSLWVWTDRNPELEGVTWRNLGKWSALFDGASFYGDNGLGGKVNFKMEGFVIDDKERFMKCGAKGSMLISWHKK